MPLARFTRILGFALVTLAMIGCSPATSTSATAQATPPQPFIALFTDYGWDDPYVAQLKGVIVTIDPAARLLDLTHTVSPFNVAEGAYLLEQSAAEFPAGTIFVAVVDPQVGTERTPVLVETSSGKFYVGPDNGLFSRVIEREGFAKAWQLNRTEYFRPGPISNSFHGRDIFGPVAAHLAAGVAPEKIGTEIEMQSLLALPVHVPTFNSGSLAVEVVHIDRFGNVILNFASDNDLADKLKEGNLIKIAVGKETHSAPLVKTYGDLDKGRMMLLYGGSGLLEISINQGSAAKELKVERGAVILLKP